MSATTNHAAVPLSVSQEALWLASVSAPSHTTYNEAISIRKRGAFDPDAFRAAFNEILRRHRSWRTTFDRQGGAGVQIAGPAPTLRLPLLDLAGLTSVEAERRAAQLVAQVASIPYDLRRGPLVRPRLIRFPDHEHRLYLAMHHLVFDGVSVARIVLPELVALYDEILTGMQPARDEPAVGYDAFARWEQSWIAGPRAARRLAHWRRRLGSITPLQLPLDRPRPREPRFRGGTLAVSVERELVNRLREIAKGAEASLFHVLATAWSLLLGRYSGQAEVVFGTVADLRRLPEFRNIVGYALTPVVLNVELGEDPTIEQLLVRVRNEVLDAVDNALPFERIVRELHSGGASSGNPFYQTLLVLEPPPVSTDPEWSVEQMDAELSDKIGNAKVDLELQLDERLDGHLSGCLIFDDDLFERETAQRMADHWLALLRLAAADPTRRISQLPILTPEQERRQLIEWNATATERPPECVTELVLASCARDPAAVALSSAGQSLSYGALARRAAALAGVLRERGIGAGDVVAICLPASAELAVAALGVLLTGAAYLLLDPDCTPDQVQSLSLDAGSRLLLVAGEQATRFDGAQVPLLALENMGAGPARRARPASTTPTPADPTEHRASPLARCELRLVDRHRATLSSSHDEIVGFATSLADELGISSADTFLWVESAPFGLPAIDLWMPLIAGARVVVAPAEVRTDPAELRGLMRSEGVSFIHTTPRGWRRLIDRGMSSPRGLKALSGGGALTRELADEILERCRVLWNAYCAPGDGGYCTLARVEPALPITVGRPLAGRRVYVVDDLGRPVAVGVPGWLLVAADGAPGAGAGVGAGAGEPLGAGLAARTGDRARWRANGELELLGAPPRLAPRVASEPDTRDRSVSAGDRDLVPGGRSGID